MIRKIFFGIIGFYKNFKINKKLLISYFILIVIPMILVSLLFSNKASKMVEDYIVKLNTQAMEQASSTLSEKLSSALKVSDILIYNENVQDIVSKSLESYTLNQQIDDEKKLGFYFTSMEDDQDIFRVRLYVRDELIYSREKNNFFSLKEIQDTEEYDKIFDQNGKVHWLSTYTFNYIGYGSKRVISAARLVKNFKNLSDSHDIIFVDILESNISDLLKRTSINENSIMFLKNDKGDVFSNSGSWTQEEMYKNAVEIKFMDNNWNG